MADSATPKDSNLTINTPPNLKTWNLKTSIHCEGCKKKVKKILQNTPGVYDSDVDLKLQKLTVTGNIDVNALIAKLIKKTGKHVEFIPEIKTEQQPQKQQSKLKPKHQPPPLDAQKNSETPAAEARKKINGDDEIPKKNEETKTSVVGPPEQSAKEEVNQKQNENNKPSAIEQVTLLPKKKTEEDVAAKETEDIKKEKVELKINAAADGGATGETEDIGVGKKKKKKGQNRKQKSDPREVEDSFTTTNATRTTNSSFPTNTNPTRQYPANMYGTSVSYHAPPVYTVSYNTTPYPTSSYGTSYYATPPPHTEAYAHSSSSTAQYQPSDYTYHQSQPSDSFQIFSDENPNACSLM